MPYKDPEKQRAFQAAHLAARRALWISENGPCACGSFDRLEVDHIDPATKTMQPGAIWSRRAEVRERELSLCQVLCHDCHQAKTSAAYAAQPPPDHGTLARYKSRRYPCGCTQCLAANAEYVKGLRQTSTAK